MCRGNGATPTPVIDWIEFVLTQRGQLITEDLSPVTILLDWLRSSEVQAFLNATLNVNAKPVPPLGDLSSVLSGITARAGPAQVFALEDGPVALF